KFLVHGGASGIGTAAIQLAAARGATVFTTAGSDDKCRFCESLGATRAVNYRNEDFVAAIKVATNGAGVDVILDMIGGDDPARNVDLLAPQGRLTMIATMGGVQAPINLLQVMVKRLVITGSTLRPRPVEFKQRIKGELAKNVWPLLESGKLKPIVDKVFA